jgi:nitroreductase
MDFFEVVTTQRAIRRLRPDPVPEALLRQIMDSAVCAPSGGNRQGWSFLVVRDAAKRARLGELYPRVLPQPWNARAALEIHRGPARDTHQLRARR